jgi:dihydroorotate dehydrogenase
MMCYSLLRPLFFLSDPELAHERALTWLERSQHNAFLSGLMRRTCQIQDKKLERKLGNLTFPNPIGLAAGFDKDGRVVQAVENLGFGFVEVGTVTPKPQPGNFKPRLWRFPKQKALVNALGFPGIGAAAVAHHLKDVTVSIPVGVNLGKNLNTPLECAHEDLLAGLDILYPFGDFFVVNISSPNTPGLRELQQSKALERIANVLQEKLAALGPKPLLVKIAPDVSEHDLEDIVQTAARNNLAGLVVANTTTNRAQVPGAAFLDRGGLSGKPLFERTLALIQQTRRLMGRDAILIASGGIFSGADAAKIFESGADLAQIYTALIYRGPRCPKFINRELLNSFHP